MDNARLVAALLYFSECEDETYPPCSYCGDTGDTHECPLSEVRDLIKEIQEAN